IRTGGSQAVLERTFADGRVEIMEPSVRVTGSGTLSANPVELDVLSVLGAPPGGQLSAADGTLTGTWGGLDSPVLLAVARPT
ncbi:MAG: hypothetical protein JWQ70_2705, partial [Aeromicrobium sp.]|nr:hypothetical protein [Aeromicrobium sp.]